MGGDTLTSFASEDESSLDNDYPQFACNSPKSNRDEDESDSVLNGLVTKDFDQVGHQISSKPVEFDGDLRRRKIAYNDVMKNYDELWLRTESLDRAKRKVLRYTPGSWINDVGGKKRGNYVIPKTTTLLLVGAKGSGKSSLVNRISRVFEDDKFASERAQVTYNSSSGEGTFFLEEYMIPRGATSFCLFDTRSLSDDFADNEEMLQRWMTKGVRHGELVVRDADSSSLKMALKCKAQQSGSPSSDIRKVNFVIFVVNGFSVLRSMNSDKEEDKKYMEMVVKTFNQPYLSFKDDKPVVAVTHGDFLSLKDRARVRIFLGEKLGVPPAKQIFDIPESSDQATELAIVDLIRYSLEHADKNLPCREPREWVDRTVLSVDSLMYKLFGTSLIFLTLMILAILLGIACALFPMNQSQNYNIPSSSFPGNWRLKSEIQQRYEHQESSMPIPSRLWSKSAVNNSQEQQRCEKHEPETTSRSALASKYAVARSARLSRKKAIRDHRRRHRGPRSTSSKSLHPKSKVKWHMIRHLWLGDDSESRHPKPEVEWHKIRHIWSDVDSEIRHPKSAVKWHKIRHLWADDD